jgi:hypothetical protein
MYLTTSVSNIAELIHHIAYLQCELKTILWFRGQRSASWDIQAGVYRDDHASYERNYFHRFRSRAGTRYAHLPNQNEFAIWLSLMQHYGLPTRLLDWSRSPLVAAYFAIEAYIYERDISVKDAAIWVLSPHNLNLIECGEDITPSLDANMCDPLVKPAFFHKAKETNQVLAVMAAEHDLRMFVQQGCFTIHSDQTPFNLRSTANRYLSKIVIPAAAIPNLAQEVEICGFRKGDIYPDLGNLANELRIRKGH